MRVLHNISTSLALIQQGKKSFNIDCHSASQLQNVFGSIIQAWYSAVSTCLSLFDPHTNIGWRWSSQWWVVNSAEDSGSRDRLGLAVGNNRKQQSCRKTQTYILTNTNGACTHSPWRQQTSSSNSCLSSPTPAHTCRKMAAAGTDTVPYSLPYRHYLSPAGVSSVCVHVQTVWPDLVPP